MKASKSWSAVRLLLVIGFTTVAALYLAALATLFLEQRNLIYPRPVTARSASSAGLTGIRELRLRTSDGESLRAWFHPGAARRPLVVFFHGNGASIADFATYYRPLMADGDGLLAVEYRGFPGSTGSPTEAGLIADGEAAYAEVIALGVPDHRIVIMGSSLGTAVAVAVAARHPVRALVLDSPPSSVADVAAAGYWMFPARWLILDQFRSDLRIGRVRAPVLIVHGDRDRLVPIRFGKRLYAAAHQPKTFLEIPGAGHLAMRTVMPEVVAWIDSNVTGSK